MRLFFDTSALVKFFHEEEGTPAVTRLIVGENNEIWISELARIEFISALFRRARSGEVTEEQLSSALIAFEEQTESFNCEPIGHATMQEAESLIKQFGKASGLRTLDALQLGAFSLIAENDWVFVTSDNNLCHISELQGYKTINPLADGK